jgi:hypothetical protein
MRLPTALITLTLILSHASPAQAPDAWAHVQQLAPGTPLKVGADKGGGACTLQSVSADSLVCAHGASTRSIPRTAIKTVKLARRGRSALLGLALGAGIGAGAGVGVGSAINGTDAPSYLHVSGAKAAGVGAAIGAIVGAATGGIVGYSADLFAGPAIYKR